jgi:hypothetical protein
MWVPFERGAMVLVPLVAVATLALGLRIGSESAVRAAVVFGAPPANERTGLAWQLVTIKDDRGVREAIELPHVSMIAQSKGREARWDGSTNSDGVAEAWLDLPGISAGDPVSLEVRTPDEKTPLAEGLTSWPADTSREPAGGPVFARPSKQTGALLIEVAVYGGRLAPGFVSSVWVHVRDAVTGQGVPAAVVDADAEPGLSVSTSRVTTDREGWAELRVTAEIHVVALGLRASPPRAVGSNSGRWYGALPVAPGGFFVSVPTIPPGEPHGFEVLTQTVLPRVYVEVDDAVGRAFAASLSVEHGEAGPHALFDVRALTAGTYWLVTSGDPRAAETLEGAAIARPFVVARADDAHREALGPRLATLAPPRFSRFVALDGLAGRRMADAGKRRCGLGLAFGSLFVAAALEAMLVLRAVGRSRRELAAVAEVAGEPEARLEQRFNAASVLIGLLIALLGFALLAGLLTWKAFPPGP